RFLGGVSYPVPQLVHLLEDDPVLPKGNKFVRNISSGGRWIDLLNGVNDTLVYFQDNRIDADSSFYSFNEDNYRLKFDTSFYPSGFRPIPLEKIGLTRFGKNDSERNLEIK
ncbi:MAG: hypothetical protein KAQ79_12880, partial [Cyclobacteriaceae bacterium]|nr:hypothetical protein [Cyclobacteriaceae bacterium]